MAKKKKKRVCCKVEDVSLEVAIERIKQEIDTVKSRVDAAKEALPLGVVEYEYEATEAAQAYETLAEALQAAENLEANLPKLELA